MHSRRALLYMPGDDRRKIEKSVTLGVDSICMDMEDGVAANKKAEARAVIAQAMKELNFGKSERCIRINSIGSGLEKDDLAAALRSSAVAFGVDHAVRRGREPRAPRRRCGDAARGAVARDPRDAGR